MDIGDMKKLLPGLYLSNKAAVCYDEGDGGEVLWGSIVVPVALGSVIYQILLLKNMFLKRCKSWEKKTFEVLHTTPLLWET